MLLRLWLDNVLIWLLLKSLERKQQIHKTHTGSTVHTCVNKPTRVHRLYGFCNAPPLVYCTETVTPHQGQTKSQKRFNTEFSLLVVIKSKVQEAQTKSQSLSVFFLRYKKCVLTVLNLAKWELIICVKVYNISPLRCYGWYLHER